MTYVDTKCISSICIFFSGRPGLWLDSDLNKGTTDRCLTYGNSPLVPESDFIIKNLECWSFG